VSPTGERCSSLLWIQHRFAISPSGRIRFAGAKQQTKNPKYVAEANLRRMCPEPQAKGISPQGDVLDEGIRFLFNLSAGQQE